MAQEENGSVHFEECMSAESVARSQKELHLALTLAKLLDMS